MTTAKPIPAVSFQTARTGASAKSNAMGMRMSEVIPMLHKKFSQLIAGEAQTFWCTKSGWKPKSIKVDRASKMHAAFFIEEVML